MNPFQSEIDAILAAAKLKNDELRTLPSNQRVAAAAEALRLFDRADELIALGLQWAETRLATIVVQLETMAAAGSGPAVRHRRQSSAACLSGARRTWPGSPSPDAVEAAARGRATSIASADWPPRPLPSHLLAPPAAPAAVASATTVDVESRDTDLAKLHPEMRDRLERLWRRFATARCRCACSKPTARQSDRRTCSPRGAMLRARSSAR